MNRAKVYVDFQNADPQGRVRLNCSGTLEDLSRQNVELREGLPLILYSDDSDQAGAPDELLADGVANFSKEENCWVAHIDWSAIHHASNPIGAPITGDISAVALPANDAASSRA